MHYNFTVSKQDGHVPTVHFEVNKKCDECDDEKAVKFEKLINAHRRNNMRDIILNGDELTLLHKYQKVAKGGHVTYTIRGEKCEYYGCKSFQRMTKE
jgi:hypothetical protein